MKKIFHYTGELQPVIRWAVNRDSGMVDPPKDFCEGMQALMPECKRLEYWVGVITPDSKLDGDWVDGYPHTHVNSVGWPPETPTALTYAVAPDIGGELAVGGESPDDPYELIPVTPGLVVIVDAKTWHGVKPVEKGTRIAVITTGWCN